MLKIDLIGDQILIVKINYANLDGVDFGWNLVFLDFAELKEMFYLAKHWYLVPNHFVINDFRDN